MHREIDPVLAGFYAQISNREWVTVLVGAVDHHAPSNGRGRLGDKITDCHLGRFATLNDIIVAERLASDGVSGLHSVHILGCIRFGNLFTSVVHILDRGVTSGTSVEVMEVPLDSPADSPAIPVVLNRIRGPSTHGSFDFLVVVGVEEDKLVTIALRVSNCDIILFKGDIVANLNYLELFSALVVSSAVSLLELDSELSVVIFPVLTVRLNGIVVALNQIEPVGLVLLSGNIVVIRIVRIDMVSSPLQSTVDVGSLTFIRVICISDWQEFCLSIEVKSTVAAARHHESVLASCWSLKPALRMRVGTGYVSPVVCPIGQEFGGHLGWVWCFFAPFPVLTFFDDAVFKSHGTGLGSTERLGGGGTSDACDLSGGGGGNFASNVVDGDLSVGKLLGLETVAIDL